MRRTATADITGPTGTSEVLLTGLSFPVISGRRYKFRAVVDVAQGANTYGAVLMAGTGVSTSRMVGKSQMQNTAATADAISHFTAVASGTAPASVGAANYLGSIEGILTASADGTFTVSAKLSAAGTFTAKAGSFIEYQEL